jgi:hypothetical protein
MRRYKLQFAAFVFLLFIAIFLNGCPTESDSTDIPDIVAHQFNVAEIPDSLEIDGNTYTLQTYLWRDFMPVSPPDGKPMIASISLIRVDSMGIPPGLGMDFLWVALDTLAWATEFTDEARPPSPPHTQERVARRGPLWGPDVLVDVIVRIVDGDRNQYFLAAKDVVIFRTD